VYFAYLGINPPVVTMSLMPGSVRDRTLALLSRGRYESSGAPQGIPGSSFLVALDPATLRPLATIDLVKLNPSIPPGSTSAFLLKPPPPPKPLHVAITGRHVQVTWRNPGDTTHFVLEIGTIAGRSNLGILHVGNVTQYAADNVPSGRYFARVRAVNDVGPSLTSNEVVIEVP
jgi:hypothetical protein